MAETVTLNNSRTTANFKRKWMNVKKNTTKNLFIYIVLIPIIAHLLIFEIFPIGFSLYLSFFEWPLGGIPRFIGLDNWSRLIHDGLVGKSLIVTFKFALYYIMPTIIVGLILALMINSKIRGASFFKAVFFLPVVTSIIILSGVWKWLFVSEPGGIVNTVLIHVFGLPALSFFSNETLALVVTSMLSTYKVSGYLMVYFFAGLKNIPVQLYEAGKIDGASRPQLFWKITLPQLQPILLYVIIITTIDTLQVFESPYILTHGGPNYATNTIVYQIYKTAFIDMNLGYASSIAYVLFSIILLITLFQYKVLDGKTT